MLYIGTQRCLNTFIVVVRYLLKLINRDDTRLVCLLQIGEDLLKGSGRRRNITYTKRPRRIADRVIGNARTHRGKHRGEFLPCLPTLRLERLQNRQSQPMNHIRDRLGGVDIDKERVIVIRNSRLGKAMTHQIGLAITPRRNQRHIITVGYQPNQVGSLLLTIAKVRCSGIAGSDKRIDNFRFHIRTIS